MENTSVGAFNQEEALLHDCENFADSWFAALICCEAVRGMGMCLPSACHQDTSLLSGSLRFCLDPLGRFSDEQLWQMVHLMGIQGEYSTVQYSAVQYSYNTVQYSTVQVW